MRRLGALPALADLITPVFSATMHLPMYCKGSPLSKKSSSCTNLNWWCIPS